MKLCFECFGILSDKNRAGIIANLQNGELRVSDLMKRFKVGQPTVSYHLSLLKKANMVKSKKVGREIFYFLNEKYPCLGCNLFKKIKC